jgi:DNA replication factor GINS
MGGSEEEVADALDATTDGGARAADASAGGSGPAGETGSTESDGPTPVPPDPAPPGAPGVDADGETEGAEPGGDPGGDRTAADADGSPDDGADRATVRITRDVGSIFGVDEREYDLASEDVVSLPAENADPLVQRDAAERLD